MKIAVIGGGPTGMAEAIFLARKGQQVTLFEKAPELGGLAGYFNLGGVDIDKYYHFIMTCDRHYVELLQMLGVSDKINWVETATTFYHGGKIYPFSKPIDILRFSPINLVNRVRLAATLAYMTKLTKRWEPFEDRLAAEWLPRKSSQQAWDIIWQPMLDMKFGEHASKMSMAWLWARSNMVSQYRPEGKNLGGEHRGWLLGSTRTFIEAAERDMTEHGAVVRKNADIERIEVIDGKATGVVLNGQHETFDHIIYSAPSVFLQGMLPETTAEDPYFQQIYQQQYYGATCLILKLKRKYNPYFWTYVSDPDIPFVGIINYSDFTAPPGEEGHHVIYVPWYSETTNAPYTTDKAELEREWIKGLKKVNPEFDESWIETSTVGRAPHAAMMCLGKYSEKLVPLRTPIQNLTFANLSQIYPQDRGISIGIKLSKYACKSVLEDRDIEMDFSPHASAEEVEF